ncbi:hypothetical protein [Croceicoccus sp. Ery15]|uniref:hypothetical protein n=1 Tax=Croceicoccus sp. Ery15 TaxID=1703338 RepID=UPI001E57809C|nr:hypothetical protein [Croceicoccus sp. Ery15]
MWTHNAVKDGNWSDATVWDAGTVPGDLAAVNIGNFDVVYDVLATTERLTDVQVSGQGSLRFARTRTKMIVDTIMCHGFLDMGSWQDQIPDSGLTDGNGHRIPQCDVVFWASEAPLTSARLGLMTMGPVRIQGEDKLARSFATGALMAGATTITLEDAPFNWRVGDQILIQSTESAGTASTDAQYEGPTSYYGCAGDTTLRQITTTGFYGNGYKLSQDEVRTITAIAGNTITLDSALTYSHLVYTNTLPDSTAVTVKPNVAMLTHSVRFRSADASDAVNLGGDLTDLQKRAHTMLMHHDDIQVRCAESKNMARTDTNPTLSSDQQSGTGAAYFRIENSSGVSIADANNVRGRYCWHLHGSGPYNWRKQVVMQKVSAWAPTAEYPIPGWAMTHHNCRAALEDCTIYNVRGAGMVSEFGNETGQWLNNTIAWVRGDGFDAFWNGREEKIENHNGHQGCGMDNQSRAILIHDNHFSSCHYAMYYMQQAPKTTSGGSNGASTAPYKLMKRIADEYSLRFRDPLARGNKDGGYFVDYGVDMELAHGTYGPEQVQIPPMLDNIIWDCGVGLLAQHRQHTIRADNTPMVMKRCHMINVPRPIEIPLYSFHYHYYDCLFVGAPSGSRGGAVLTLGTIEWQHVMGNCKAVRYNTVFSDDTGIYQNFNGGFFDIDLDDVLSNGQYDSFSMSTDPTAHPLYNAMEDWIVTGTGPWTCRADQVIIHDSATDFPLDLNGGNRPRGAYGIESEPASMVGEPRPYVWIDPASDLTMSGNSAPIKAATTISIKGVIADSMGLRHIGAIQIFYPNGQVNPTSGYDRVNYDMDSNVCAMRNGCFTEDGGTTYKSRLWFTDIDRGTGDLFHYSVDVTLTGLTAETIATYLGDPAPEPPDPSIPEKLTFAPYVPDTSTPIIVPIGPITNLTGEPLSIPLRVNSIHGSWALTGVDAAQFTIATVNGLPEIQWTGGTQDYASPADTGGDNVYNVTATYTDFLGNVSDPEDIAVTVVDLSAGYAWEALINFSTSTGYSAPIQSISRGSGVRIADALDIDGNPTGMGVDVTDAPNVSNNNGTVLSGVAAIPNPMLNTAWVEYGESASLDLTGLDPAKTYDLVLMASINDSSGRAVLFRVNGVDLSPQYDASQNTSNANYVEGVSPNGSGKITITILRGTGSSYTYISALRISEVE